MYKSDKLSLYMVVGNLCDVMKKEIGGLAVKYMANPMCH